MAAGPGNQTHAAVSTPARRLTACIITLNEEAQLADCLRSLDFCDEIVVVDSHSTDRTRDIAASFGARVIERDWPGYRSQKQFPVEAATHDWVVSLDADERLSEELREEIVRLRGEPAAPGIVGYRMPRMTRYFGEWIRHGDWYPDRLLRVFDRRHCRFGGEEVHEKVVPQGKVATLRHPILHDSYEGLDDQVAKLQRYARMWAEAPCQRQTREPRGNFLQPVLALLPRLCAAPRSARWLARPVHRAYRSELRSPEIPALVDVEQGRRQAALNQGLRRQ